MVAAKLGLGRPAVACGFLQLDTSTRVTVDSHWWLGFLAVERFRPSAPATGAASRGGDDCA